MIRFLGAGMIIICGSLIGQTMAENTAKPVEACEKACNLISQMLVMLEFECPTIDTMLERIKSSGLRIPCFVSQYENFSNRADLLELIKKNSDCYLKCDRDKLYELFLLSGKSDKLSEIAKLKTAEKYFTLRASYLKEESEKRIKLQKRLGILFGILAAVMLL